jgi:uncharacterized membrane protein YczE
MIKNIILRYLTFITGLYFLSLGIVLIVASSLGTTPISSVNYVVTLHTPITLGTATFLINVLLIAGQFWLIRSGLGTRKDRIEILLQLPFSLVFSIFIDINMAFIGSVEPTSYPMALAMLGAGCLSQATGVVLELKPNVAIMSAEGFVKYAARRYNKDFGRLKVIFDIVLVSSALLLGIACSGHIEGVREGTVIAALSTGFIVSFLSRHVFTRAVLRHLPFLHS